MKLFLTQLSVGAIEINVPGKLITDSLSKGESEFKKIANRQPHPCDGCGAGDIVHFFVNHDDYEQHPKYKSYITALIFMIRKAGYKVLTSIDSLKVDFYKVADAFQLVIEKAEENEITELTISKGEHQAIIELRVIPEIINREFEYVYERLEHPCIGCMSRFLLEDFDNLDSKIESEINTFGSAALIMEKLRLEDIYKGVDFPLESIKTADLHTLNEFAEDFVTR